MDLRDISFFDYYQFSLKNIGSGESFNHLVSNGICNIKAVLIVPLLHSLNNNVNALTMVFLNLWDTLTTLTFLLVVLMFYTKTHDTLTSNLTTNYFTC